MPRDTCRRIARCSSGSADRRSGTPSSLARRALQSGSRGLLLPMPMFFRYDQEDLKAFCAYVSDALRGPCLLYNLPDFTNGLEPDTVVSLLRDAEFIVGIKDSSGQIEHLNAFAAARGSRAWTLLVGDDRALYRGLQTGWNGGISGVAGFCPELLVALYRSHVERRFDETARLQVTARRTDLADRPVSDSLGHPGRTGCPGNRHRPAAASAQRRASRPRSRRFGSGCPNGSCSTASTGRSTRLRRSQGDNSHGCAAPALMASRVRDPPAWPWCAAAPGPPSLRAFGASAGRRAETALHRERFIFAGDRGHVHASSVVETPNGSLLAVWYENGPANEAYYFRGGDEDKADDVRIAGARLRAGSAVMGQSVRHLRHFRRVGQQSRARHRPAEAAVARPCDAARRAGTRVGQRPRSIQGGHRL